MSQLEELPVPLAAIVAKQSAELARIWIVDGDQFVTLSPRLWDDPGAWGLMLVDLARHVSNAYASRGIDPAVSLSKIREAMDAEWSNPTS